MDFDGPNHTVQGGVYDHRKMRTRRLHAREVKAMTERRIKTVVSIPLSLTAYFRSSRRGQKATNSQIDLTAE